MSEKTNHLAATVAAIDVDVTVDAIGLNCPLPILKARKALMEIQSNQVLKVIATDPTSAEDFPVFAQATGYELLGKEKNNEQFIYYFRAN